MLISEKFLVLMLVAVIAMAVLLVEYLVKSFKVIQNSPEGANEDLNEVIAKLIEEVNDLRKLVDECIVEKAKKQVVIDSLASKIDLLSFNFDKHKLTEEYKLSNYEEKLDILAEIVMKKSNLKENNWRGNKSNLSEQE